MLEDHYLEEYHKLLLLCRSGKEMIQKIWTLPSPIQINIIVLLWRWWSVRNKVNTGGVRPKGTEVASLVTFYALDFEKLRKNKGRITQASNVRWEAPPKRIYKFNIDTTFFAATGSESWGFMARDYEGVYLEGGCGSLPHVANPLQGEAMAALCSSLRAAQLGMSMILLETDATELKRALTMTYWDRSVDGVLFRHIRSFMNFEFDQCTVRYCLRSCHFTKWQIA
jgi:hypothetical protein